MLCQTVEMTRLATERTDLLWQEHREWKWGKMFLIVFLNIKQAFPAVSGLIAFVLLNAQWSVGGVGAAGSFWKSWLKKGPPATEI